MYHPVPERWTMWYRVRDPRTNRWSRWYHKPGSHGLLWWQWNICNLMWRYVKTFDETLTMGLGDIEWRVRARRAPGEGRSACRKG